jgi:RNA polymerase sigma factor FliA
MQRVRAYEQVASDGDDGTALVLKHLAMVKRVALHLKVRLPPFMELDELVQVGTIGLLEASRSFDASKGVDFEDFAFNRIRGAIIDEARRMSSMPRSAIANLKSHSKAAQALANQLGRAPRESELAAYMGKDLTSLQRDESHAQWFDTVSMETVPDEVLNVPGQDIGQPEQLVSEAQLMGLLTEAIGALPERDQLILSLYYSEGLNLREIGETLGVTESRISQILSANVKKLRASMGMGS